MALLEARRASAPSTGQLANSSPWPSGHPAKPAPQAAVEGVREGTRTLPCHPCMGHPSTHAWVTPPPMRGSTLHPRVGRHLTHASPATSPTAGSPHPPWYGKLSLHAPPPAAPMLPAAVRHADTSLFSMPRVKYLPKYLYFWNLNHTFAIEVINRV